MRGNIKKEIFVCRLRVENACLPLTSNNSRFSPFVPLVSRRNESIRNSHGKLHSDRGFVHFTMAYVTLKPLNISFSWVNSLNKRCRFWIHIEPVWLWLDSGIEFNAKYKILLPRQQTNKILRVFFHSDQAYLRVSE